MPAKRYYALKKQYYITELSVDFSHRLESEIETVVEELIAISAELDIISPAEEENPDTTIYYYRCHCNYDCETMYAVLVDDIYGLCFVQL